MLKFFKRGLVTLAPLAITITIAIWILWTLETAFSIPVKAIIGERYYFPGTGILLGFLLIFFTSLLINTWFLRKIYDFGEKIVQRIPLIKSLYNAIQDVFSYLQMPQQEESSRVVRITINQVHMLGLITREDFTNLPKGFADKGHIAVYLPMSYQVGGYTVLIERSQVTPLDMTVEQAMRYLLIAGAQRLPRNSKPFDKKY